MVFKQPFTSSSYNASEVGVMDKKNRSLFLFVWICLIITGPPLLAYGTDRDTIQFTSEERTWLDSHKKIVVGGLTDWPPVDFTNENGEYVGIANDYLQIIGHKLGIEIDVVTGQPWSDSLSMLRKKEIDIMPSIYQSKERQEYARFTSPYIKFTEFVFTRSDDSSIIQFADLKDKTVVVVKGYTTEQMMRSKFPDYHILVASTNLDALEKLVTGEADAYIGELMSTSYNIKERSLVGITPIVPAPFKQLQGRMAVRKDWPILHGLIEKVFNSISRSEKQDIKSRWVSMVEDELQAKTAITEISIIPEEKIGLNAHKKYSNIKLIGLSDEETDWINTHPRITVNGGEWEPFILKKGPGYEGISVDILERAASLVGLQIDYFDGPWSVMMEMLKSGELDLVQCISKTPERDQFLDFTDPYLAPSAVVFVPKKNTDIHSTVNLKGKIVAVEKSTHIHELLNKNYPNTTVLPVNSTLEGLRSVGSGEAAAFVGTQIVAQYKMQKHFITELKIVADLFTTKNDLRFGTRKENSILVGIMQKSLASMSEAEITEITSGYIQPITDEMGAIPAPVRGTVFYKQLAVFAAIVVVILILLAVFLLKVMEPEKIAANFGSSRFRLMVLLGLTCFLLIVAVATWFSLGSVRHKILLDVERNLKNELRHADHALEYWAREKSIQVKGLGRSPVLAKITEQLLQVTPVQEVLVASQPQKDARAFFANLQEEFANIGFFIISADYLSLGSMRDSNVGTRNLIAHKNPDLMRRAFNGEVLFVPSIRSDVFLDESSKLTDKKPLTMFFMGPVYNSGDKVIAVFTLRIDPGKDFSNTLVPVDDSVSQEAYAFNGQGVLLTRSRFEEQLVKMSLLEEGQQSVVKLRLQNPGVNLTRGETTSTRREDMPLTLMATRAIASRPQLETLTLGSALQAIETDLSGYRDYRGVFVFGAWLWEPSLDIGIAVEIDTDEALANYYYIRNVLVIVLGLTLLLSMNATLLVLILGQRTSKLLLSAKDGLENTVAERTAELAVAEEHFKSILATMGEGLFQVDAKGVAVYINPAATAMLGYSQEEIVGKAIHDLIHHTHGDGSRYNVEDCPMNHAFTQGVAQKIANEVLWRKDGTAFPVEYSATPMQKDGLIAGAVVAFRDVSERIKTEKQLHDAKDQLESILDTSPIAVAFSNKGIIRFTNPAFEAKYGVGIGDESPNLYVNKNERDDIIAMVQKDGQVINHEVQMYAKEKQKRDMLISYLKITYNGKEGVLGWLMDITERKQMEAAITSERDQLQNILNTSPVGVAITVDGVFRFMNETLTSMTGLAAGDKATDIYVDPSKREVVVKALDEKGKVENFEVQFTQAGDGSFDALVSYYYFQYKGKPSVLGWIMDISDMKHIENELRTKFNELDRFRRLAVGRELKMIELKKEINALIEKSGDKGKYKIH